MEKLDMQTKNLADEKFEALKQLFPNAVTETMNDAGEVVRAVEKDVLMQEIAAQVVEGRDERYQFTWPDKRQAILAANAPLSKTLRPAREESVNFDDTENLYIEGDNLDVLKLLQETYLGKIKMIYIDPPYNTGSDFVYKDDFKQSAEEYIEASGQYNEEGNRLEKNIESNGRFHTDWLNMIYPRLKLARNLLSDDGVIFISIDDNEQANLKKVCDEIFGEGNFVNQITLLCNPKGRSQDKYFATCHEYLLVYSKNILPKDHFSIEKSSNEINKDYPREDQNGKYRLLELRNTHREFDSNNRPNLYFPLYVCPSNSKESSVSLFPDEKHTLPVEPLWSDGHKGCWTWGQDLVQKDIHLLMGIKRRNTWKIYRKSYAVTREGSVAKRKMFTVWKEPEYFTEKGQAEFGRIFPGANKNDFPQPKSPEYIKDILRSGAEEDSIILDFFSGSATTAHAVMDLNAEDGGNRKYILVQLPEETDEQSEAYKAGYKTICDIGKERIRRAGQKILEEHKDKESIEDLDIGFRVLKIDSSNMKDVYYEPDMTEQGFLDSLENNIKEDRSPEDLLFQVMLDLGIPLSADIQVETIGGKDVYVVEGGFLIACFDAHVGDEVVMAIAEKKPYYAVFRDASMARDSVATNFDQIFESISPETVRRVL